MSPLRVLLLATTLAALACASTGRTGAEPVDAVQRLEQGMALLADGDYRGAYDALAWVYARCHPRARGREALLTLAAVELDPRNPYRRIDAGADLAGRFLARPTPEPWARPVAASLYLMARELGGAVVAGGARGDTASGPAGSDLPAPAGRETGDAAVAGCGEAPADATAGPLPELPGPPTMAYLLRINSERQRLEGTLDSLHVAMATLRDTLAAREQELERIRRTLKP